MEFKYYDTPTDYVNGNNNGSVTAQGQFIVNNFQLTDFVRHALNLFQFNGYTPKIEEKIYCISTVKLLLDNNLDLTDGYINSEASIKGGFSFFLGMTITSLVAEKLHGTNVIHLKDSSLKIAYRLKNSKGKGKVYHPDFLGIRTNNSLSIDGKCSNLALFEAKGRIDKLPQKFPSHYMKQLKNVDINLVNQEQGWVKNSRMDKYIIYSHLDNSSKTIKIYDIDPPSDDFKTENNLTSIEIDEGVAAFTYYYDWLYLLKNEGGYKRLVDVNGHVYFVISLNEYSVGLRKEIYEALQKYFHEFRKELEENGKISERLSKELFKATQWFWEKGESFESIEKSSNTYQSNRKEENSKDEEIPKRLEEVYGTDPRNHEEISIGLDGMICIHNSVIDKFILREKIQEDS